MSTTGQPSLIEFVWRNHRGRTALMVFLLGVGGVLEGLGVAAVLPILDTMLSGDGQADSGLGAVIVGNLEALGLPSTFEFLLIALVIAFTLKGVVLYFASLQTGFIVARMAMELRLRLLRAIVYANWHHVLQYPSGFIANAISTETQRTTVAYQAFTRVLSQGIQVGAYLAIAFAISWRAAATSIVAGLLIVLLLQRYVNRSRLAGGEQVSILRSILAKLTDALPSLKPLKAMGMESYLLPRLEEATEDFFQSQKKEIASTQLIVKAREPILMAVLALGFWGIVTLTSTSTTSLMVLGLVFYRIATNIANMQQFWVSVRVGEQSFHSLMEHLTAAEAAKEEGADKSSRKAPALRSDMVLEDLTFSYGDHPVLDKASARLASGTFVALSGPSGAGKTTLVDLITGLIHPQRGRVVVDGVDLATVSRRSWRDWIGYVPQEPMLFSDTIRENVSLGVEELSDGEVVDALKMANAWEFVSRLPGGLDHRIGESGTSLSGGQRQRLAIARALVGDTRLLILDEPTTALDSASEEEVCSAISQLRGRLTVLAISHQDAIRRVADEHWEIRDGVIRVLEAPIAVPSAEERA